MAEPGKNKDFVEPSPRYCPYSAVVNGELCLWGAKLDSVMVLQVYHPYLESWSELNTYGGFPTGLYYGASAGSEQCLYVYGGFEDAHTFSGSLHMLNISSSLWIRLPAGSVDVPMKKAGCRMVIYKEYVIVMGGFGIRNGPIQNSSEWMKVVAKDNDKNPNTVGWTNEMHKYDLKEAKWSSILCTGSRPPPCSAFSLTTIDHHRVVLFGGVQAGLHSSDVFILELTTMCWSKIPYSNKGCHITKRFLHAAVCLDYNKDSPKLLVIGGIGSDDVILNDLWMMDVKSGRWNKIEDSGLKSRCCHCAAAFSLSPGVLEVTLFGGASCYPPNEEDFIADTNVLTLCKAVDDVQSEWTLTDVADNTQIGMTKRISDKMAMLNSPYVVTRAQQSASARHVYETKLQEVKRSKYEAALMNQVVEKRIQGLEEKLQEAEQSKVEAKCTTEESNRKRQEAEVRSQELQARLESLELEDRNYGDTNHWLVQRREILMTNQKLGGGGWGEVMVANFRGLQVAAKVLYRVLQSPYYHSAFVREMNMASRVRHPNLVQFIGASMDEEMVILMELMPTSLREYLSSSAPVVPSAAFRVSVSLDVARALNYLHLMKPHPIIHRDISSANVLLEPLSDQKWRAKVTDYGSVNLQSQINTENPGNPVYSAPESRIPSQQTAKMDSFSFGVLLIELNTVQFPDEAMRVSMLRAIKETQWVVLIQQCIHRDQTQRPSMVEIITQLSSF